MVKKIVMKEKLLNVIKGSDKIFIEGIYDYLFENRDNLFDGISNDEIKYRCVLRDYDYVLYSISLLDRKMEVIAEVYIDDSVLMKGSSAFTTIIRDFKLVSLGI
jgi:hypothetical protein